MTVAEPNGSVPRGGTDPALLMPEAIYTELRTRILNGDMSQGQRLVVARLSEEFGASAIPVREALRMLQRDGLVTVAPNRGASVVQLDPADVPGAYLLRGTLEGLATRLAGPQLLPADFRSLDEFLERMDIAAQNEDFETYYRLNREFHSTIFSACPHGLITETLQRTWDRQPQFGLIFSMDREALAHSRAEHLDLVAALRTRSWTHAEMLARHHKFAVGRRLLRALGQPIPEIMLEGE